MVQKRKGVYDGFFKRSYLTEMKKEKFKFLSADNITIIKGCIWRPEGSAKGILQIVHGMSEFIDRYNEFAEFLNKKGYIVVGHDQLGHGNSVTNESEYGYFGYDKNLNLLNDIDYIRRNIINKEGKLPYFLMGHSMGSFLVREYIGKFCLDNAIKPNLTGVIIMGTGWESEILLSLAEGLLTIIGSIKGWHSRSKLIDLLVFGKANKRIENQRTVMDWLTRDAKEVDFYLGNKLCRFTLTVNGYKGMFRSIRRSQDVECIKELPDMNIIFLSGTDDPIGGYGDNVRKAYFKYIKNSECDVKIKLYEGARHELLHEINKKDIYNDILKWLEESR